MQLLQVVLLFLPTFEHSLQSTLLKMMEYIIAVLLLDALYMICKGCFCIRVNCFNFVESSINFTQRSILPFIEIVSHVSFHESHYLHIDTLVFP